MLRPTFPLQPSLWATTAVPAPPTVALTDNAQADVVVIGGGFCGLSTALHLAESGANVALLEAREIGFGASGRNGGQVIPGLKFDPEDLMAKFGAADGERIISFASQTADVVFELIAKHQLNVPHLRKGWVQGAHNTKTLKLAESRVRQWRDLGAPVRLLDQQQICDMLGTNIYLGGWIDERAGAVQPLSYARELARAAISLGAKVFTDSPVTALSKQSTGWQVKTASGAMITTDQVVICTNGYSEGLWPNLQKTVVDAVSYLVATEPLPDHLRSEIAAGGQVCSDARNLLVYFRQDHTGRFLIGGRGPYREPKGEKDWALLESIMLRMFPQLKGVPLDHRWCGRVAVTRDFLPHIHCPAPGMLIDIGCMGRGVGLQSSIGRAMARHITHPGTHALPFKPSAIEPLPMHALRGLYVNAMIAWYRLKDL